MTRNGCKHEFIVALLLLALSGSRLVSDDASTKDWLRSSGNDLEMRLRGEIFEANGEPAFNVQIQGGSNGRIRDLPLVPKIDGNRFEVWIPVNSVMPYSLWLTATSQDDQRLACKKLNAYELRQAATDGIKLTLKAPTRRVKVAVTDKGRPVPGAAVKAELGFGIELRSRTNSEGIAQFGLLPDLELYSFSAWTDDFRIGGFQFSRKPTHDPTDDEFVVELSLCRDQKLRFVDDAGVPIPGIDFVIQVATPAPNFNFLGTDAHSRMTSDAVGEVTYRWFPDWEKHHFYVELNSKGWVIDGEKTIVDGVAVFKLKKSHERRRITGSVVSPGSDLGGFYVRLTSFQAEQENMVDSVVVFTDANGMFSVDVLPDATYVAYVLDAKWVGEMIDLIPYQSATGQFTSPKLSVSEGQEVEVLVTSGPEKKPYPNLTVSFHRRHPFKWLENGTSRGGAAGPQWWGVTDDQGRVVVRTLPGKFEATVYTPLWRTEQTVDVKLGEAAKITLHRPVESKRMVRGRLALAAGLVSNLDNAEIQVGSVDGKYEERRTLKSSKDGSFSFEILSETIGIFAYTQDGHAAGSIITKDLESPIELELRPTIDFHGQLLGENDRPLTDQAVRVNIYIQGEKAPNSSFIEGFEAKVIQAKTDNQGNYTLPRLPAYLKLNIYADGVDAATRREHIGEIFLEPNESRPRAVANLGRASRSTTNTPLATRYEKVLRDCALGGFHLMVIVSNQTTTSSKFVNENLMDYESNKLVGSFMQLVIASAQEKIQPTDAKYLSDRGWSIPSEDRVFACALDAKGNELGRLEFNTMDKDAKEQAAAFVHQHAPAQLDAEKKWQSAFAEATRTNRRVWVRISQRYCAPCFSLARWLDEQQELLAKDYVMLKIDDVLDQNGFSLAERIVGGKSYSIPFHAIYGQDQAKLIDSAGPLGNIGFPSGFDGKKHLRKMLLATKQNLSDAEIEQLLSTLKE